MTVRFDPTDRALLDLEALQTPDRLSDDDLVLEMGGQRRAADGLFDEREDER